MVLDGFNLYTLFVENVFGGILYSGIGLGIVLFIIGTISRMSPMLIYMILILFFVAFSIGYVGALAVIPFFMIGLMYFSYAMMNWMGGQR